MALRRIGAVAFSALLLTGLAACGDDDGGSDDAGVNLEDADNGGTDTTSSDESSSDDSSSGDSSSDDSSSGDSNDAGDVISGAFSDGCGDFANAYSALLAAAGGAFAGEDSSDAEEVLQQAIDDAPDEIADDIQTIADAYDEYIQALEDSGIDFSDPSSIDPSDIDNLEELASAAEIFNDSDFQEASNNLNDFVANNCET
jgi:hypothetical protein